MSKYIDAVRLKAEIEKRMHICDGVFERGSDTYYQGKAVAYQETLSLIDSLQQEQQEEPDKSLEEAAEKRAIVYAEREKPKDADGEIWRVGDVMIENRMSFEDGFKAGAEWAMQQLKGE